MCEGIGRGRATGFLSPLKGIFIPYVSSSKHKVVPRNTLCEFEKGVGVEGGVYNLCSVAILPERGFDRIIMYYQNMRLPTQLTPNGMV